MKLSHLTALALLLASQAAAKETRFTLFDFGQDKVQAWSWVGPLVTGLEPSKDQAPGGKPGMAIAVSATARATTQAYIKLASGLERLGPGSVVEFRLWIPAGSQFSGFEPYSSDSNGKWAGVWTGDFKAGQWNSFTHHVPCDAGPLSELGLYLFASDGMRTTAYLDSVEAVPGSSALKDLKPPVLRTLTELP